jgi:hypothetical protein
MTTYISQQPQVYQTGSYTTTNEGITLGAQGSQQIISRPSQYMTTTLTGPASYSIGGGQIANSFSAQPLGSSSVQTTIIPGTEQRRSYYAPSGTQQVQIIGGSQTNIPSYTTSYPAQVISSNQIGTNQIITGAQRPSFTTYQTSGPATTTYQTGGVTTTTYQTGGSTPYQINSPSKQGGTYTTSYIGGPSTTTTYNTNYRPSTTEYVTSNSTQVINTQPKMSIRSGGERVINETKLPSRVIDVRELPSTVVGSRELQSYEVSRHVIQDGNARVTQNQLPTREQRPSVTKQTANKDLSFRSERAVINQKVVEKMIDVTIEKPVPNYIERIVPYDVIVEKPREIITEKDVITEVIIERPFEKIIEVPIQKIVEVPIKKTIERINYVDVVKPVVVDRVVERQVEQIVENPVYHDNVMEVDEKDVGKYKADGFLPTETRVYRQDQVREVKKVIPQYIEKTIEVPREVVVENRVARTIERPVEVIVEKPVVIQRPVEKFIEVPYDNIIHKKKIVHKEEIEYVDQIVEQPVEVPRYVEKPRQVIEERIVHKNVTIDRPIQKKVDKIVNKQVFVEKQVFEDVPEYIEKPRYVDNIIRKEVPRYIQQEVIYETVVPVEKENIVEETIYVPIEKVIDRPVEKTVEKFVENIIEKEVIEYNIIEDIQYVDKDVTVQVERKVENPVVKQNIIQKPRYIDRVVERKVPRNIEKVVEVKVDKIIEVPVEVVVEVPIFKEKKVYKDVLVNKNVRRSSGRVIQAEQDFALKGRVEKQRNDISELKTKIARIRAEYENWTRKQVNVTLHSDIDYTSQNEVLQKKILELEQAIKDVNIGKIRKSLLT